MPLFVPGLNTRFQIASIALPLVLTTMASIADPLVLVLRASSEYSGSMDVTTVGWVFMTIYLYLSVGGQ